MKAQRPKPALKLDMTAVVPATSEDAEDIPCSNPETPKSTLKDQPPFLNLKTPVWSCRKDLAGQQAVMNEARLAELLAAVHRQYKTLECQESSSGTRVQIIWHWPAAGRAGHAFVQFLPPIELAIQLAALREGAVDDHRSNEGGLLYLVGHTDVFWSCMLHLHSRGTCLPVGDLFTSQQHVPHPPLVSRGSGPGAAPRRVVVRSRSSPELQNDAVLEAPQAGHARAQLVEWCVIQQELDAAFKAASLGLVDCCFFSSNLGCANGSACTLRHDERRRMRCRNHAAMQRGAKGTSRTWLAEAKRECNFSEHRELYPQAPSQWLHQAATIAAAEKAQPGIKRTNSLSLPPAQSRKVWGLKLDPLPQLAPSRLHLLVPDALAEPIS